MQPLGSVTGVVIYKGKHAQTMYRKITSFLHLFFSVPLYLSTANDPFQLTL